MQTRLEDGDAVLTIADIGMPKPEKPRRSWRLFRRREVPLPTWRGLLLILVVTAGLGTLLVRNLHRFLAVDQPLPGGVLVVEGWTSDQAFAEAARRMNHGDFSRLFVTGGPLEAGATLSEYKTYAQLGTAVLMRSGMNTNLLTAVPSPWVRQDRTFTCAVTLRQWFRQQHENPAQVTILTSGAHARRSRLLFQQAFGKGTAVGVIAVPPEDYDPARWWTSSQGVRVVIGELLAYGYARVVFRPPRE
jgi:uncharacterized SAM-binding protein YcdF (DUF218 family)